MSELVTKQKILLPTVIQETWKEQTCLLNLHVPEDLFYFDGHFDEAKILPGVVQIEWAVELGNRFFDIEGSFEKLEVVKFQHVIVPDDDILLELSHQRDKGKLYYCYSQSDKALSSGRIVFRK